MKDWQWPIVRDSLVKAGVASVAEKERAEWDALGKRGLNAADMKAERELMGPRAAGALQRAAEFTPSQDATFCPRCWALYMLNETLTFPSDADEYVDVSCGKCGLELRVSAVKP